MRRVLALGLVIAALVVASLAGSTECFEDGSCRTWAFGYCVPGELCSVDTYPEGRPW